MEYLKIFEDYFEDEHIPKISIDGIFYHGTVIQDKEFFDTLETGYSDWEALWFADDDYISKEFSDNWASDDSVQVIFKVHLKSDSIADIDYELFKELEEYYGLMDFREIIPILESKGFDGWKTTGSIDYTQYDDYALFEENLDEVMTIKAISFKIDEDEWSEYIPIEDAEDYFNSKFIN